MSVACVVLEGAGEFWAAAVSSTEAAARRDAALMKTMVAVMRGWSLEYEEMCRACPLNQQMWTVEALATSSLHSLRVGSLAPLA